MTPEEAIEALRLEGGIDITGKPKRIAEFFEGLDMAIEALKEVQQYRKIGTVEECRKAVKKQSPKKIVYESDSVFCDGFTYYRTGKCPVCDKWYNSNDDVNYCSKCGQAISWEESEEE